MKQDKQGNILIFQSGYGYKILENVHAVISGFKLRALNENSIC